MVDVICAECKDLMYRFREEDKKDRVVFAVCPWCYNDFHSGKHVVDAEALAKLIAHFNKERGK